MVEFDLTCIERSESQEKWFQYEMQIVQSAQKWPEKNGNLLMARA